MSNSLTQVRRAYRQDDLRRICTLREDRFARAFGLETVKVKQRWPSWRDSERPEDYYHFRDNGASVLAVAHLDTVVSQKGRVPRFYDTKLGPAVISGALDDRLGAYVILSLLPKLGVTCDWLLTVGEESGQSTAEHFDAGKHGKEYDWVIEFDRMGTDVVMYQYEDEKCCRAVEACGATMGKGSFSDIAYLEQCGVKAFNWGVGYRGDYHSEKGYAYLNDTFGMVAKYLRFHEQNAGVAMPHDCREYGSFGTDVDRWLDCPLCDSNWSVDPDTRICFMCETCTDCQAVEDECLCYLPKQHKKYTWDEYLAQRSAG